MKTILIALALLVTTGCASIKEANIQSSVSAKQFITPTDGSTAVYIYTSRVSDLVTSNDVFVGDKCVGTLNYSAFTRINIPAGKTTIGIMSYQGINKKPVTLKPNSIYIAKAESAAGFSYYIRLVSEENKATAMDTIKDTSMVVSACEYK